MGNRGDVYEQYYMPAFIDRDCQAIYLDSTGRDDLIQAVGRLARHERTPTALTDVQKFEISRHPDLLELIEKRAWYVREIKDHGYPTIKAAKNTRLSKRHKETQAKIKTLKRQLSKDWLEKTIEEFYKTVHTIEVDQQLQGIRPADLLSPPSIEYELEERATVAKLLFKPLDGLPEDQILKVRIELVENLVRKACSLFTRPSESCSERLSRRYKLSTVRHIRVSLHVLTNSRSCYPSTGLPVGINVFI
jgi:CRISPR/Cas system-associated endonuclease/helicase Cas3